jgi:hypothetical protein
VMQAPGSSAADDCFPRRTLARPTSPSATFQSSGSSCCVRKRWRISQLVAGMEACPRLGCEGLVRLASGAEALAGRGEHTGLQLRLPPAYLRFGDGLPGRHQIGGGCSPGLGDLAGSVSEPEGASTRTRPARQRPGNDARLIVGRAPSASSGGVAGRPLLDLRSEP